jgi:hypothetical protein
MLARESWLAGSIFWSSSPGKGRLEGREMVVMLGMVVVAGQEAWQRPSMMAQKCRDRD